MAAEQLYKYKIKSSLIDKALVTIVYDEKRNLLGFLVYGDSHPFKVLINNPPLAFLPTNSRFKRYPNMTPPVEGAIFSLQINGSFHKNEGDFEHLFRVISAWLGDTEENIEIELKKAFAALKSTMKIDN